MLTHCCTYKNCVATNATPAFCCSVHNKIVLFHCMLWIFHVKVILYHIILWLIHMVVVLVYAVNGSFICWWVLYYVKLWLFLYEKWCSFCDVVIPSVRVFIISFVVVTCKKYYNCSCYVVVKSCKGGAFFMLNVLSYDMKVVTRKPLYSSKSLIKISLKICHF